MRYALPLAFLTALALGVPANPPVMPYDPLMEDRVSVDGYVDTEEGEYPATFTDKASGLTVHWGFDDSSIYVALESKGKGWMAIGFGSPNMDESNVIIGYYCDDSAEVFNQVGVGPAHTGLVPDDSFELDAEIDRDDETGITTLEFIYPLAWPPAEGLAISGLVAGDIFDMILAQNTKSISFSEPSTNKSALKFKMAPVPGK
jgi:hypothetical protein